MPEPVMCPSCGRTLPGYPAGGKCPDCGAAIPAPHGQPSQNIDEEIVRLSKSGRNCPTCGKVLPPGSSVCPVCDVEEAPPERKGMPGWAKVLIVLGFALVAGTVIAVYMSGWSHEKHVRWVEDDLADAAKAADANRVGDAVAALKSARSQLDWFDEIDPTRAALLREIEKAGQTLRTELRKRLREMIARDEVVDAQRLYESEIKPIDVDGALRSVIEKALADRKALRGLQRTLKHARKLYEANSIAGALKEISALRTEVQDPLRTKGEAVAGLRATVEKLQSDWVNGAYGKGMDLLKQGKLREAAQWFKLARVYVWSNEVPLRRKLQEALYHIAENRVVGVFLNINSVRIVKPETVRSELLKRLNAKLADEGFLTLVLETLDDAKASELHRIVLVDYKEEESREFRSETMLEKAMGTKITCLLKVRFARGGEALWEKPLTAQTGTMGGLAKGEFNDAILRLQAARKFWRALDGVRISGQHLLP